MLTQSMRNLGFILITAISTNAFAAEDGITDLDLVWVVLCAVLVFLMQAGFSLIEAGMSRAKNAVNVMMKNYTDVCVSTLVFWVVGYNLMFGANSTGFAGTLSLGVQDESALAQVSLLFQIMFAATAATICSGAMAERTKYTAYLVSTALLVGIVYSLFGSWVWNSNGWLAQIGFIDFAGSTVVHSVGAWCALAGVLVIGPRLGRFSRGDGSVRKIQGHNLTLVGLGGFILWFGWFGFNAGSTLEANASIAKIALNTHLAACAGALGSTITFVLFRRPVLMTGVVNGSLAGLVSITAGCASMDGTWALVTGFIGGVVCVGSSRLLLRWQIDDVVGAIPVHGFAGAWGTLAAGAFVQGNMFNWDLIGVQLIGIIAAFVWAFCTAYAIFIVVDQLMGLRSSTLHEQRGLDVTEHAETAFPEFQTTLTHNNAN